MFTIKPLVAISVFILLLWGLGYIAFLAHLEQVSVEQRERKTDAVVILTGGNFRVQTGLELFSDGMAPKLFITGVHESVKKADIISLWKGKKHLPECCIILGHTARTTIGNAVETREWLQQNNIKSIRLVTSFYHMPRALIEFKTTMPDVEIIPHPVEKADYSPEDPKYWNLTFSEYNKSLFRKIYLVVKGLAVPENE